MDRWNALKLVVLTRLPPLFPYPVFNYAFGLTKVPYLTYAIGSILGIAPVVAMDAYLGSLFESLAQARHLPKILPITDMPSQVSSGKQPTWYIGVAIGVTVVATVVISWEVKRMLKKVSVGLRLCFVQAILYRAIAGPDGRGAPSAAPCTPPVPAKRHTRVGAGCGPWRGCADGACRRELSASRLRRRHVCVSASIITLPL